MKGVLTVQKIEKLLFEEVDPGNIMTKDLTDEQKQMLLQYRCAFTYWLEHPILSDKKVVEHLRSHFPELTEWNARYAISSVKKMLGSVNNASKEWQRFTVIEMAKKIWATAEAQEDVKGMAMAANLLGKYTKLDKNEQDEIPYDQIIPPSFEPSSGIAVLDSKLKIENLEEKKRKLREKYKSDNAYIEDAQVIEDVE